MARRPIKDTQRPMTKKPSPPAERNGASDELVHRNLSNAIIQHQIPPGTPLPEDALSAAFGLSRTVIRKALQRLSHEKLVDIIPNKGASVARPSMEEARQVFEARRVIEKHLTERLASSANKEDVAKLYALVAAESAALESDDRTERLKLSGQFHRELAALSGNAVLADFVNKLISRTSLIIALYESPGAVPCSHSEHKEIVGALERNDAKKAALFMDHHLMHIEAQIELAEQQTSVDFKSLFGT